MENLKDRLRHCHGVEETFKQVDRWQWEALTEEQRQEVLRLRQEAERRLDEDLAALKAVENDKEAYKALCRSITRRIMGKSK